MKLFTIILLFLGTCLTQANPELQRSQAQGSFAHLAKVKTGQVDAFKTKTAALIKAHKDLQFHHVTIEKQTFVLATRNGARSLPMLRKQLATLEPQLDGKWQDCETICQLRPHVSTMALHSTASFHAAVTELQRDKEADYRNLHNHVWPGVISAIGSANIPSFDLFLLEVDGKLMLFYLFEHRGEQFDADMKRMAENPINQRWWKFTDVCQKPLPGTKDGPWLGLKKL